MRYQSRPHRPDPRSDRALCARGAAVWSLIRPDAPASTASARPRL